MAEVSFLPSANSRKRASASREGDIFILSCSKAMRKQGLFSLIKGNWRILSKKRGTDF